MAQLVKKIGRAKNLLIELGTEELPPKSLKILGKSFSKNFFKGLVESGIAMDKPGNCKYFATPRRLAVWVKGVIPKQPDQIEEKRGPAIQAAFSDRGEPTPAALGFAKSCGIPVNRLKKKVTDKGSWLVFEKKVKGNKLHVVITQCMEDAIKNLPIPKRMRWGSGDAEFVRPAHWLLALYGSDVVKTEVLGLKANRFTRGHRFHCPDELKIPSADRYLNTLKTTGFVIADYEARQSAIVKQINRVASKADAKVVVDQKLLDEVTGLVEWPVALVGEFSEKFLKLPKEVLVSTMVDHQKYFHLTNKTGKLVPLFITVSNLKSRTPKRVRQGNERVLRARLSDAEFFWHTDQKSRLDQRIESLKGVMFHNKLGSIYDKTIRIGLLADAVAACLEVDRDIVQRAVKLCKTDLVTDMVGEFPELQGTIGKYYARNQGEDKMVVNAIDEHYLPRFAGDKLPSSTVAQCVAIGDRLDTLCGIFASGEIPTGDKDPFALRRAALGVVRIMIEGKLDLSLKSLIGDGMKLYAESELKNINADEGTAKQLYDFCGERLKGYFQTLDFSSEQVASVLACAPNSPLDYARRLEAVNHFFRKRRGAAESLTAANKRIANILSKSSKSSVEEILSANIVFDKKLGSEEAEMALADSVEAISKEVTACFAENRYDTGFERLATLRTPIDQFFDQVLVMHEDKSIRDNRIALLMKIRQLFLGVADISRIKID